MSDDVFFIEPREGGGYRALKEGAQRASLVTDTQREAIEQVKQRNPTATIHVARVRNVGPGPDKFRKVK